MHTICEATHDMINRAAYENGWMIHGIVTLPESSGTVEVKGIVMFQHHNGVSYGVADYVGNGDTLATTSSVHFSRGAYDLDRGQALSEMDMRAQRFQG